MMKTIISLAAEAEILAMYVNAREGVPARQSLDLVVRINYYARAVDPTMLVALSAIASEKHLQKDQQ